MIAAGAAASAAYYKKEDIGVGYTWAMDHMKYVGSLWDETELKKRLDTIVGYDKKMGILFRTYVVYSIFALGLRVEPGFPKVLCGVACEFVFVHGSSNFYRLAEAEIFLQCSEREGRRGLLPHRTQRSRKRRDSSAHGDVRSED